MEEQKKVYIGNLEYSVNEEDIQNLLQEKGLTAKEIRIVKDKYTDRSKGFGFAEFETDEEVQQAIEALDGCDLKARKLKVSKARKRDNSRFNSRRDGGGGGGGGGYRQSNHRRDY